MENEMEVLNPDIQEVQVGVRTLRKIKLYPLSVTDQFKLTDLFQEALGAFLSNKQGGDLQFIALFVAILKTNLSKILELAIDSEESATGLLNEITNNQLSVIATLIYEKNYELISKNVSGLLKKIPQDQVKVSPLERPLQQFVPSTDINSMTFSGNLGETEE